MDNIGISELLDRSSARHRHLCPRQVLGVRIGLAGVAALGLQVPCPDKRLLVILETDGCFADGIEVATGCTIGHRTLRVKDFGKIAATFVDVKRELAMRIAANPVARQLAYQYVPGEERHYCAQLEAYQVMPENELIIIQPVKLMTSIDWIVCRPGRRAGQLLNLRGRNHQQA